MMPPRRGGIRTRHEFRFGTREVSILAGVLVLIVGLTFAFGVLVGRELGATSRPSATTAATPSPPAGPGKAEKTTTEERLTFYQTLTAPTPDLPATGQAAVEERMVPHDAPPMPAPPAETATRRAPPKPERRAESGGATGPERAGGARPTAPAGQPPAQPPPPPVVAATPPGAADPQVWTVQVSSFRSRTLAEELRARLAAQGFDAYVVSMSGEEGRVRHRVRVGGYVTRGEAERVAQELRGERNLNPFVTTRAR